MGVGIRRSKTRSMVYLLGLILRLVLLVLLSLLLWLVSCHLIHVTKNTPGSTRLGQRPRLSCEGNMAVVCRRKDGTVVVVGSAHFVFCWRRPKTTRVKGSFVGQRSLLQLPQAQRRRYVPPCLLVTERTCRRREVWK